MGGVREPDETFVGSRAENMPGPTRVRVGPACAAGEAVHWLPWMIGPDPS